MGDLQSDLAMGAYRHRDNKALAEKMTAWKKSLQKVEMAYEILAYPRLETVAGTMAVKEAIRDALAHPNQDTEERPHRAPIELNDDELKILGRLTQARDLPFDPNKRVYRYMELASLREAENIMANTSEIAQRGRQNAIDVGMVKPREEIEEEIRKRQEQWRRKGSDEPPAPPKPQK
jgi:hypothetical protein